MSLSPVGEATAVWNSPAIFCNDLNSSMAANIVSDI